MDFIGELKKALGLQRNTQYQRHYMYETNISTAVYLTFIVMALELWMIIRYVYKRPGLGFWEYFDGEKNYLILFGTAAVLFFYSVQYIHKLKNYVFVLCITSVVTITDLIMIVRGISYGLADKGVGAVLFSLKYNFALMIFCVSVMIYELVYIKNGHRSSLFGQYLNAIFALICVGFGMEVSVYDVGKHRQILCFVTMVLFLACLVIWKPVISFLILGSAFLYFYTLWMPMLMETDAANGGSVMEGDRINYVIYWFILFVTSVSIYQQRHHVAEQEEALVNINEKLNRLAVVDELTGINNMYCFVDQCRELLADPGIDPTEKIYLFMNIGNFRTYNDQYGYQAGNGFLINIAQTIAKTFGDDPSARQSDDHFVVLTDVKGVRDKINIISGEIRRADEDIYMDLKVGACRPKDRNEDPRLLLDRARYACGLIKKEFDRNYIEYSDGIDSELKRRQYIVNNIDTAIRKGYIHAYYQPVVDSGTHELKGVEALARWIDPTYGFISPAVFVPVLEEYRQIHKLDRCIYERVCENLRDAMDKGLRVVPVSLNFSRLDFELMDAVSYLEGLLEKYNIRKDQIHVEITESALTDTDEAFKTALRNFEEEGFEIWLDDFGSGYSSLNVLKDYRFDVVKIDMKFLAGIESNDNARTIIGKVIELAESIGMVALSEGVESEEIGNFLRDKGCNLLQGYYYGKPMPREEIRAKIASGEYIIKEK